VKPLLIDLFCCQGGASAGYVAAGFDVIGVDINPQPRYPYRFIRGDALEVLPWLVERMDVAAVHASPPCQAYTNCQRIRGNTHPDLVAPVRAMLQATGLPYVIENVEGAPLHDPVMLCGAMWPWLRVYRHRLFESNVKLTVPEHPEHVRPLCKMGRAPRLGEFMHVVGNFSGVAQARTAMGGIDWMNRDGLRESIPPLYAQHVGLQLMAAIRAQAVAA
jgi:DNA (cytosine-5)-methyltransferase 1